MTDNKRLREVLDYLIQNKVVRNQQDFTERLGEHKGIVSNLLTDKRPYTQRFVNKVCEAFPMISDYWLLTGNGFMINTEKKSTPKYIFDNSLFANDSSSINTGSQVFGSEICNECKKKDNIIFDLQQEISNLKSQIIDLLMKK